MNALRDENGKVSSTRISGLVLVVLLIAVIISNVWFGYPVIDHVYDILQVLIIALVAGVTGRAATQTLTVRRHQSPITFREDGER